MYIILHMYIPYRIPYQKLSFFFLINEENKVE